MEPKAFGTMVDGYRMIFSKGFRRYALIPILINLILFVGLYSYGLIATHHALSGLEFSLPSWLSFLAPIVEPIQAVLVWLAVIAVFVIQWFVLGAASTLLTGIIASPFNAFLCEKILKANGIDLPNVSMAQMTQEALVRQVKKMMYYLPRAALVFIFAFICMFIPVLQLASSVAVFLFGAWMLSIEYLDYPQESMNISFNQTKMDAKKNRRVFYSFGAASLLITSIPVVNFLVVPASVAGATKLWLKINPTLNALPAERKTQT